ncbi:MAG TPA: PEGA domain-containing protein [Polyangiaceae bacterium]|nr:PEGA domain-containing protein [Polyangiaceae bacterium]
MIGLVLAVALFIAMISSPALADAPHVEPDTKELLREGFAALKKNDIEAAHAAFTSAWEKRQHFAVAFSLAEVEMRLGRHVEAAHHWQYVLANLPDDLADKRDQSTEQLEECRRHIGTLTVQVNMAGASIHVDGVQVGEAPLRREVYVAPGDHELYAEKGSQRSPIRFFRISAGSNLSFSLTVAEGASPGPSTLLVRPARPAASNRGEATLRPSMRTPVLVAGLVVTAGAAALGTTFVLKSNAARDDAQMALDQAVATSDPTLDPSTVCGVRNKPPSCDVATQKLDEKDRYRDIAVGSFIAGGVAAVGTAAAAWFWPTARQGTALTLTPMSTLSGVGGGALLSGAF